MSPNPYQWQDLLCVTILVAVVLLWLNDPAGVVGTFSDVGFLLPASQN